LAILTDEELAALGIKLYGYCQKYTIPVEYVFQILNDQKVTPMTRGKAMEYNAFLLLDSILDKGAWSVQKLNVSAQPGSPDQDISITHRRTAIVLKIESKSAVRGAMASGKRAKLYKVPHFKVKCHRSRSNISLAGTSNDRYGLDVFDIILTTPLNALYEGNTVGEDLELIKDDGLVKTLYDYYNVDNEDDLLNAAANDWRFVIPADIAENGYIPRTPYVLLKDDPNWRSINDIEPKLLDIVKSKLPSRSKK
jgi:hypothetical protein